ncbi:OLC1v1030784C1 [Oldenlandia corymbosa var. corymbosa]|uniref:OLC1v1030784C1 n=1 Tax=Oldenlandia corymbosa var. corymbosa TaxID=529605 RepID=A0AAV1CGT3_OLDCO|nr:OLC1v1030784C1 [Oldenlandia corymbosa var. corymbosa]
MTFDCMERYGVQPDILAVNSLLSAICRENNQTAKASDFFERIKTKISPDAYSFAILLEGWEKEGNVVNAKSTFGEMVVRVGWSPGYVSAYDAFLMTLVGGNQFDEAMKFLKNDSADAILLWDTLVDGGLVPNLSMYKVMVELLCNNNDVDNAFRLLDVMIFHGAFPDSLTYNTIFEAIGMLFERDDPETAIEIWEYMVENHILPLEDSANALLIGLCDLDRATELRRYADEILDRRIRIYASTKGKLKSAFCKGNKNAREVYDYLSRKWKSS